MDSITSKNIIGLVGLGFFVGGCIIGLAGGHERALFITGIVLAALGAILMGYGGPSAKKEQVPPSPTPSPKIQPQQVDDFQTKIIN